MENKTTNKWIICRICLKSSSGELLRIFSQDAYVDKLAEKIQECGGIPVDECSDLPDSICSKCLTLLKVAHKFRSLCQKSHHQLVEILQLQISPQIASPRLVKSQKDIKHVTSKQEPDIPLDFMVKAEVESSQDDSNDGMGYIMEDDGTEEHVEPEVDIVEALEVDTGYMELPDSSQNDDIEYLHDELDPSDVEENCHVSLEQNAITKQDESSMQSTEEIFIYEHTEDTLSEDEEPKNKIQIFHKRNQKNDNIDGAFKIVPRFTNFQNSQRKRKIRPTTKPKLGRKSDGDASTTFICYHCGNIYSERAKLTLHLKVHSKEKPHECEICHKRFAQTPQLSRHMNSHTGSRPFKCKFCPSSFADPSTCIKHERIHTNERPYKCETCGKAFSYSNVLKVHLMTHTGEKPYSCEYCGKRFAQLHHRKAHERTHNSQLVLKQEEENDEDTLNE